MRGVSRALLALGLTGALVIGGSVAAGDQQPDAEDSVVARVQIPSTKKQVNVYWAWDMPTHPVSTERIAAGARLVNPVTPATAAINRLLNGPNVVETNIGMITLIPPGTTLNGISINNNTQVATIDLSPEYVSGCGALIEQMRLAQVVFTLTQFDNVDRVKFMIDGVRADPIMCHGAHVGTGLDRDDFAGVRSLVMVEHPHPGARVVNDLVVRGESNTFEANVRYILTDRGGDGRIIDEGFTTATNGNGTWGTYEIRIDLDALPRYAPGPAAIIVWEENMEAGTMGATVEYPIRLPPRCDGKAATILGTRVGDDVTGTDGRDVIVTRSGNDVVWARGGADRVCLGGGDDWVLGGRQADSIFGGPGDDTIRAGFGADDVYGRRGGDTLLGGPGPDELRGGFGPDVLAGGLGDDELFGGPGQDGCVVGPGDDVLIGCEMVVVAFPPPPPPVGN